MIMMPISHSKISQIVDFEIILQAYFCENNGCLPEAKCLFSKAVTNFSPQLLCDF